MINTSQTVSRYALIREAQSLRSEHGENPEYDRALAELIYWSAGGDSVMEVAREIGVTDPAALWSRTT